MLAVLLAGSGCRGASEAGSAGDKKLGELRMELTLPNGHLIETVNYSIEGSLLAAPRTGSIGIANVRRLGFHVGDLPVGPGYTITLAATTSSGLGCLGMASFEVSGVGVTSLSMELSCSSDRVVELDEAGELDVDVAVVDAMNVVCPVVSGISAGPLEVAVGSAVELIGHTTSAPATYDWLGTAGVFSASDAAATSYGCTVAGEHVLTFGIEKPGCPGSAQTVMITCSDGELACGALVSGSSFELETDRFESCAGPALPDRAFEWTAPDDGFFEFRLRREPECSGTSAALELRRGGCPEEPSTEAPLCGIPRLTQDGCGPLTRTLWLESGEAVTAIVEGERLRSDTALPQQLELEVVENACPYARSASWTPLTELSGPLPQQVELNSSPTDAILRDTVCSFATGARRQATLAWTAPDDGTYRFAVTADTFGAAIALLDGSCTGAVLACTRADGDAETASVEHSLGAGQQLILLLEVEGFSDDDISMSVQVER